MKKKKKTTLILHDIEKVVHGSLGKRTKLYANKQKHSDCFILNALEFIVVIVLTLLIVPILGVLVLLISLDEIFEMLKKYFKRRF